MHKGTSRFASPSSNGCWISPEAVDLGRAVEPLVADGRLGRLSGRPIQHSVLEAVRLWLFEFSVLHNDLTTPRMIVHDREHRLNVARPQAFRSGRSVSLWDVKLARCHLVAARSHSVQRRTRACIGHRRPQTPAGRGPSRRGWQVGSWMLVGWGEAPSVLQPAQRA